MKRFSDCRNAPSFHLDLGRVAEIGSKVATRVATCAFWRKEGLFFFSCNLLIYNRLEWWSGGGSNSLPPRCEVWTGIVCKSLI